MATEVREATNGKLKKDEVEPLGELEGKEILKKPAADLGDVNGCDPLAEKEEPILKLPTPNKQKGPVLDGGIEEEGANEPQGGNDYSSDEEEEGDGEGEEDARERDGEPYEEDNDEEYVDDGEDDEGDDDDDESQPPPKRRK